MESREVIMPAVETRAPKAASSYQLALTTNSPTQTANPSPLMGPPGFSAEEGSAVPSSLAKKKRGRPRKYGPDGTVVSGGRILSPMPLSVSSPPSGGAGSGGAFQVEKKKRKMSSSEKSNMFLGDQITSGGSFAPHMVTVNPGEANSSRGTVTYKERFEILSLSGSFTPGEVGEISSRDGGMSIALSSPNGRVVGGLLGGLVTTAGPVLVVVASFLPDVGSSAAPKPRKPKSANKLLTPVVDPTTPVTTNTEEQNFNEQS